MKLETKSFRTKVARRIFTLFIICAIVPVSAMSWVSFGHVKKQLSEQSRKRLRQESKSMAVSIYERLLFIRAEMKTVASNLHAHLGNPIGTKPEALGENLAERLSGMALFNNGDHTSLFGRLANPPKLTSAEMEHINSGKALLHHRVNPDSPPVIYMCVAMDPEDPRHGILLGKINRSYLWEAASGRPIMSELLVLDRSKNILFSSFSGFASFPEQYSTEMIGSHAGHLKWSHEAKGYFASYSTIFLKPNFFYPEWKIVLSESREDILAPMANFKKSFPVLIILSLGMVFFISMSLIRKNMTPIEILRGATGKIAQGAFGHKVEIRSGDEFESLGSSFNEMSKKLKEGRNLLVQAAKMSTMGQMAAGTIHEVRQPLTAIYGLLQLSLMDNEPPGADSKDRLKTALKAVERLDAILARFKSFSQMSEETIERLSVIEVIDQVYKLLEHQLGMKKIRCNIEHEEGLPPVLGDSQGLQQVVSNLLINAEHALEDKQDGPRTINIKTYSLEDKVFLELEDNGCGIPEDIRKRIFDPFFTTKEAEKGSGLGMAITESILHKHNARIGVESEVGVGTKFTIVFPAYSQTSSQASPQISSQIVPQKEMS